MPRSEAQSDFVVQAAPTERVGEPSRLQNTEANPTATRWIMRLTFVMLLLLVLLCLIGPHIPSGG